MSTVYAFLWEPGLSNLSSMALGTAQSTARALNLPCEAIVVNPAEELVGELRAYGLGSVTVLRGEVDGGDLVGLLAPRLGAGDLLFAARSARCLSLLPRLAARTGGACVLGAVQYDPATGEATSAAFGGAVHARFRFDTEGPRLVGVNDGPRATRADSPVPCPVNEEGIPADSRLRVSQAAVSADGRRLEDSRVVVSGGRGLRQGDNYRLVRELASALGGLPGASRAIVDEGWATAEQQIGLTGKIVAPELYIAAGISGASQHMAGCSNSRVLVAINTDPNAPIFRYAQLGIVDDCLAVLPELISRARDRAGAG
ncbi:MAG TPA: electron transfer flavoprotein subunit alpha/FixB family protein [Tepidiformaceae bacterium]|nr:electron transfer flavoprotein subunit alpha/FixB family protein [Tepidiformaceae bacterium]HMO94482.1 electron transfer flavoprotein subunit alpha/FixB family protein [Tepidiformaceae bacterium]